MTFRAVSEAGFDQRNFKKLKDVILVTEAEAAAFYTMGTLDDLEGEDAIVVCPILYITGGNSAN